MTKPPPAEAFAEAVAIIGRTGAGKTYAAKWAVEAALTRRERVCIIDPTSAWWGLKSSADGQSTGFPVAVMGGDHADVPITEASGPALADVIAENNLPAIIDVSEMSMSARVRFMTGFLEQLYSKNREPLTLVIDEADLFAPQRPMPDQTVLLNRMEQIVRRGRIRGFRPWLITQRPAELHKSVLSQASTLVAMRLTAPQDRDALGAWIDGQGDREQGKAVLATLPKLKPGEGFVWCPAIDYLQRVRFPAISTFDSGRTPTAGEAVTEPTTLAEVDISGVLAALEVAEPKATKRGAPAIDPDEVGRQLQAAAQEAATRAFAEGYQAGQAELRRTIRTALGDDQAPASVGNGLDHAVAPVPFPPLIDESGAAPVAQPEPSARKQGAELRILRVLAQRHPARFTMTQWATLAGMKRSGGTWSTYVSRLRQAGYLAQDGNHFGATPAGIAAAGAVPPRPKGGAETIAMWKRALSAAGKVLDELVQLYPQPVSRKALADRCQLTANAGTFNTYVSRLRSNGLLETLPDGRVRAAQVLWQ